MIVVVTETLFFSTATYSVRYARGSPHELQTSRGALDNPHLLQCGVHNQLISDPILITVCIKYSVESQFYFVTDNLKNSNLIVDWKYGAIIMNSYLCCKHRKAPEKPTVPPHMGLRRCASRWGGEGRKGVV
jgi:hypothetical protein